MRDLERSQWEAHFAERTFPKKTSWTSAGLIPSALSMAAEKKKKKKHVSVCVIQKPLAKDHRTFNRMGAKLCSRETREGAVEG